MENPLALTEPLPTCPPTPDVSLEVDASLGKGQERGRISATFGLNSPLLSAAPAEQKLKNVIE